MKNVDKSEIAKFADMAANWWDPNGECRPLHELNPLRLKFIEQHVELDGAKAIDIGCGGGILTESLARSNAETTGIDLAKPALEVAKVHARESKLHIDYHCIAVEAYLKKHTEQYDVVTCMEMLEHVPDPKSIIKSCAGLAKPNAKVFFSTLNRTPKAFLQAIIGAEYLLRMLPRGTHQYSKFIRPSELTSWCREVGLHPVASTGITYSPLSKTFSLTSSLDVNYLICCEKDAD